jgi:prophage DNA circulation protein
MSFRERLRSLEYTSPSGESFSLRFTAVSREAGKKAPVSEFPGQNQGAVQDLGQTTARFPVTCFIDGDDYDREADRFWRALNESGSGVLDHPRYGTISVLPVSVSSTEAFVDGAGRANFEIEFVKTDDQSFVYPRSSRTAREQVRADADAAAAAATAPLERVEIEEPGQIAAMKDQALAAVEAVNDAFATVTGITEGVRSEIQGAIREITDTIDSLIESPIALANSLLSLYRLPADVISDVKEKIDGYTALFQTIAESAIATTERYGEIFGLFGSAQVQGVAIAAAESTATGTAETRESAAAAVESLRDLSVAAFAAIEELGVEEHDSVLASRQVVTSAIQAFIESILNLPIVRVYQAERAITPIELAYQLYGIEADIDAMTDRIIAYNSLTGEKIILIPAGEEVRWYE